MASADSLSEASLSSEESFQETASSASADCLSGASLSQDSPEEAEACLVADVDGLILGLVQQLLATPTTLDQAAALLHA